MGFFEAAKAFVTDPENIARAKALATDENVDMAAGKLKQLAPEQARGALDGLAEKAKEWGGPEDEEPAAAPEEKAPVSEGSAAVPEEKTAAPEEKASDEKPDSLAEAEGEGKLGD
ncbi:hypothetical protein GCM10027059_35860 [Myceligenerans halotolerans]